MRTPPPRHPRHGILPTASVLLLILTTLSGCSATPAAVPADTATPVPAATATPTETPPVFASNEEALAAAEAAYAAYLEASNHFLSTSHGDAGTAAFASLVSERYLPEVLNALENFAKSGHTGEGSISFDTASLIGYSEPTKARAEVAIYLCSDLSSMREIDEAGVDVTRSNRTERNPTQVAFVSSETDASKLLVDREETWTGRNFCG